MSSNTQQDETLRRSTRSQSIYCNNASEISVPPTPSCFNPLLPETPAPVRQARRQQKASKKNTNASWRDSIFSNAQETSDRRITLRSYQKEVQEESVNENPLLVMKLGDGTVVDFDAAVSASTLQRQLGDSHRQEVAQQIKSVKSQLETLLASIGMS